LNKPVKEVVHLGYLAVYHEVLKHEDILDIELSEIYNVVQEVIRENLVKLKMSNEPDGTDIEILVSEVMSRLCDK